MECCFQCKQGELPREKRVRNNWCKRERNIAWPFSPPKAIASNAPRVHKSLFTHRVIFSRKCTPSRPQISPSRVPDIFGFRIHDDSPVHVDGIPVFAEQKVLSQRGLISWTQLPPHAYLLSVEGQGAYLSPEGRILKGLSDRGESSLPGDDGELVIEATSREPRPLPALALREGNPACSEREKEGIKRHYSPESLNLRLSPLPLE